MVACHGALPAASDAKRLTYIFLPGRREKDIVATAGNTGLLADTLISKGKSGIHDADSNPAVIGPPSLRPGINQEILEDRDKRKASKMVGKEKELRPITVLLNDDIVLEKAISARKLLRSNMTNISELDLMAWSPTLCNEFKQLLTRKSRSKMAKAKVASATTIGNVSSIDIDDPSRHSRILASSGIHKKAFRLSAVVITRNKNGSEKRTTLSREKVQADQGSDMNVISTKLSHHLSLELIPLSKAGFSGMSTRTTDNKETALQHIVKFTLNVQGIIRPVQAFIAPPDNNTSASWFSLLLGIPWLYQVDATVRIRQFAVTIGDKNVGETPRDIVEAAELGFLKSIHRSCIVPPCSFKVIRRRS